MNLAVALSGARRVTLQPNLKQERDFFPTPSDGERDAVQALYQVPTGKLREKATFRADAAALSAEIRRQLDIATLSSGGFGETPLAWRECEDVEIRHRRGGWSSECDPARNHDTILVGEGGDATVASQMLSKAPTPTSRDSSTEARLGDPAIRAALVARLSAALREDEMLVHELGLLQGSSRVDVAVVNGCVHGYEIKSDVDTLARLAGQLEAYSRTLHYVTIVVTAKHASAARKIVPRWWGIDIAETAADGVLITSARKARRNSKVDPFSLAQLLWRDEVIAILRELGAKGASLRGPRRAMWRMLVDTLTAEQLSARVCARIRARGDWREERARTHAAAS